MLERLMASLGPKVTQTMRTRQTHLKQHSTSTAARAFYYTYVYQIPQRIGLLIQPFYRNNPHKKQLNFAKTT